MGLRIMVIGGGAREHALLWKLSQCRGVDALLCAPGNAGTASLATNLPIEVSDLGAMVRAADHERVDLVVIGPEEPLARGLADRCAKAGVRAFGPTADAARIESSKSWAKALMTEARVPTARGVTVTTLHEGLAALREFELPVVIKADGLASGKGVVMAATYAEAETVLTKFLEAGALGSAGQRVVIEVHLVGREVSVLALSDGKAAVQLPAAADYKAANDGDQGPNTGGMGAYAPVPAMDASLQLQIQETILEPTVAALAQRRCPLRGVLYAGLMLTQDGPVVLEFNARFGDPEAQVVLPLLDTDLTGLLMGASGGELPGGGIATREGAVVGVVLASGGYPGPYRTGVPIHGLGAVPDDVLVFHAGTHLTNDGTVVTAGGRVLTVVGQGQTLAEAREHAYAGADAISFAGVHRRSDIALRELR
ncbi:MAG TPA: phosphoribosylamine--glycine ligase [Thermomicrobiales bacterium]|nr:phosphoribosylamine--glycine ligase [Thermomicrobiales bacterium]